MTGGGDMLVRCHDLVVGYRGRGLFPAVDLTLRAGQVLLVVGRNGAGKSTWLKTVLGLVRPIRGSVELGVERDAVAYVPQAAGLDPMLPLRAQNVVDWGRVRGWSFLRPFVGKEDRQARKDALAEADATALEHRPFHELSGGQQQRILFARLLASHARLALLDEPTASLDMASERDAYKRIGDLAHARGLGVIIVTHTLGVAAPYADSILFVDTGGRRDEGIAVCGPPREILSHPRFVRHFGDQSEAAR